VNGEAVEFNLAEHERNLLNEINADIKWYKRRSDQSHFWHKSLSSIVIVGAIFAPLSVVGASATVGLQTANLGALGISADILAKLSVILTITVGLAEGFRRRFQFEHKWHAFYRARVDLDRIVQDYVLETFRLHCSSPDREIHLRKLIQLWRSIVDAETKRFFDKELEASEFRASARPRTNGNTTDPV
jgi:hypothetical protein